MKHLKIFFLYLFVILAMFALLPIMTTGTGEQKNQASEQVTDDRAERIDAYFQARNMPLAGYGYKFVEEADKNGIDWRLLAAISVKESSGGKHMCKNNPFGWGSCRITFNSIEEAIEKVSWNLGGHNPRTASYYNGDSQAKLHSYNGTVEPEYPARVLAIMELF